MLEILTFSQILFAFTVVVLAYVVRGITGFGSALIAVPLLAFMLPLTTIVPLIVLLDFIASASHGLRHWRAVRWSLILPLLPFTLTGVGSALFLLRSVDMTLLRQALGLFIIGYALYSLFAPAVRGGHSRYWAMPAGGLGGLIGTLFGTGGPFYVIYLQLQGLDKTAFRATIASIFLIDGGLRLSGFISAGFYHRDSLILVLGALPVMLTALYLGGQIHTNLKTETFRRGISLLLIGSGLGLLLV
ncbi:hypothetical protein MNBD_GAMMA24-1081 [hydrothermal vent metagenome]|uniref:Membrane transporter protein n=1 Tax=hydrothermal vent metagenome TaxID=652676 RepID=A0A3B1CA56_9ZZZZ